MNVKKKKRGGEINSDGSKGNGGLSDTSKQYGIIEKGIVMKKAMHVRNELGTA
jgi:hypothetical protein